MKMRGSGNEVIAERQPGDGDLLKKAALTLSRRRVVGSTFAAGLAAITMQFLGFSPAYADCSSAVLRQLRAVRAGVLLLYQWTMRLLWRMLVLLWLHNRGLLLCLLRWDDGWKLLQPMLLRLYPTRSSRRRHAPRFCG